MLGTTDRSVNDTTRGFETVSQIINCGYIVVAFGGASA